VDAASSFFDSRSVLQSNRAPLGAGGAVFWRYISPTDLSSTTANNSALWGDTVASLPDRLAYEASPECSAQRSGQPLSCNATVLLQDSYNQTAQTFDSVATGLIVPTAAFSGATVLLPVHGKFFIGPALTVRLPPSYSVQASLQVQVALGGKDVLLTVSPFTLNTAECGAGWYQDTQLQVCRECAQGSVTAQSGLTTCDTCAPGRAQNVTGATKCFDCPKGRYSKESGSSTCSELLLFFLFLSSMRLIVCFVCRYL
jgi:hypothetical protein